jgi:hypothetical protein
VRGLFEGAGYSRKYGISFLDNKNRAANKHLFKSSDCLCTLVVTTIRVYWCPVGDMSWVMRIQNQTHYQTSSLDFPLTDITTLFMPSLSSRKEQQFEDFVSGRSKVNSENLAESEYDVCFSMG